MKILTYMAAGMPRAGVLEGDLVQPIRGSVFDVVRGAAVELDGDRIPLADVTLAAPLRPPVRQGNPGRITGLAPQGAPSRGAQHGKCTGAADII